LTLPRSVMMPVNMPALDFQCREKLTP
jgi:hypothetical protein